MSPPRVKVSMSFCLHEGDTKFYHTAVITRPGDVSAKSFTLFNWGAWKGGDRTDCMKLGESQFEESNTTAGAKAIESKKVAAKAKRGYRKWEHTPVDFNSGFEFFQWARDSLPADALIEIKAAWADIENDADPRVKRTPISKPAPRETPDDNKNPDWGSW